MNSMMFMREEGQMANCGICGCKLGFMSGSLGLTSKREQKTYYVKCCDECDRLYFKMQSTKGKECEELGNQLLQRAANADEQIKEDIAVYVQEQLEKEIKQKEAEQVKIQQSREKVIHERKILITTGNNFEGYEITEYLNLVQGEIVLGTGFLSELSASINDTFGSSSGTMTSKLSKAKSIVEEQLVEKTLARGANALVGVEFDISVIGNNMIVVSGYGTAVVIRKK